MTNMWIHDCKEGGRTATLVGEPCNWCDVTMEDIQNETLKERQDVVINPENFLWTS